MGTLGERSRSGRLTGLAGALVLVAAGVAACGSAPATKATTNSAPHCSFSAEPPGTHPWRGPLTAPHGLDARETAIADGAAATTDQVLAVAENPQIASDGTTTAVLYAAGDGEGEGDSRLAWRLYDRSWRPIAQGSSKSYSGPDAYAGLSAVPGGYYLKYPGAPGCLLDDQGTLHGLRVLSGTHPTQAGDVEAIEAHRMVVRASDRTLFRPTVPALPKDNAISSDLQLTSDGTWLAMSASVTGSPSDPMQVLRSNAAGTSWQTSNLHVSGDETPEGLVTLPGRVLVWTVAGSLGTLHRLYVRTDDQTRWVSHPVQRPLSRSTTLDLSRLRDGRLLAVDDAGHGYLSSTPGSFTFTPLTAPERNVTPVVVDGTLYWTPISRGPLLVGTDDGRGNRPLRR